MTSPRSYNAYSYSWAFFHRILLKIRVWYLDLTLLYDVNLTLKLGMSRQLDRYVCLDAQFS